MYTHLLAHMCTYTHGHVGGKKSTLHPPKSPRCDLVGSLLFHVLSPKQLLIDDSYPEAYWGQDAEGFAPHITEREPSN